MVFSTSATHAITVCSLVCLCCGVQLTEAASKESYYRRSRCLASVKDVPPAPGRSIVSTAYRLFGHKFDTTPYAYYNVPGKFIKTEVLTQFDNDSCPNYREISTIGTMKICPTYHVIEQDTNRIPELLTQVKCRCLHCLGPWNDRTVKRCTPLFDFPYVLRVVGINNGQKHYALVREPQSFACVCIRRHDTRYVMAP